MKYNKLDSTDEVSLDLDDADNQNGITTQINLIDEQAEILKQIFSFGQNTTEDDGDPIIEVGDHQKVPRTLFTFKALIYDKHG